MTLEQKSKEYQAYLSGKKMEVLRIRIPMGPLLTMKNIWDYKANLTEVSFKTSFLGEALNTISPFLTIEEIDLSPVTTKKVFKIKVLRQNVPSNNNSASDQRE